MDVDIDGQQDRVSMALIILVARRPLLLDSLTIISVLTSWLAGMSDWWILSGQGVPGFEGRDRGGAGSDTTGTGESRDGPSWPLQF